MAIPDFQTLMFPVLKQFADGTAKRSGDIRAPLALEFGLAPDEVAQRFARGVHTVFGNRIAWAITYLRRAAILDSPRRGVYVITPRGRDVLKELPANLDIPYLRKFPEFVSSKTSIGSASASSDEPRSLEAVIEGRSQLIDSRVLTPDEQVHIGAARSECATPIGVVRP